MKLFAALIFGFTSLAFAQTTAQPTADQRSVFFSFNQANVAVQLDQKDFQTIYRTDQVQDTCFRDEIQGTRTQCHTENDRRCHTENNTQCHTENFPVCTNIPRRQCHTTNQCHNVPDRVCNSHGCTTIQRRVCQPVQSCSTTNDRVCHHEQRRVCNNFPQQVCQNFPHEVCQQVPNHVQVPYSCTRTVQVPIGQELKFHTVANVQLNLVNFAEVGATQDILHAQLNGGMILLTAQNPTSNAFIYQIVDQQRSEQMTSATEKVITYHISVVATSIQKLNDSLNAQITNTKLFYDRLDFSILGSLSIPFKGHVKVVEYYHRKAYIIIDSDFASNILVGQNGVQHLSFSPFGIKSLESATHLVELSLSLDFAKLQGGIINPTALDRIQNKAIMSSFEAYPVQ